MNLSGNRTDSAASTPPDRDPEHERRYFEAVDIGRRGDLARAEALFRSILEENPDHIECWGQLAYLHELREEMAEAIGCYRRILAIDPDFHLAKLKIADSHLALGEYPAAHAAYRSLAGTEFAQSPEVRRKLALTEPTAKKILRRLGPLLGLFLRRSVDPAFYAGLVRELLILPKALPALREVSWSAYLTYLSRHYLQEAWYVHPIEPCDSCGGGRFRPVFFHCHQKVVRCEECGLEFVERRPSQGMDVLTDHYSADETVSGFESLGWRDERLQREKLSLLAGLFEKAGEAFPPPAGTAFEIGFGEGYFLATLRGAGFQVSGIETSARLVEQARAELDLEVEVATLESLDRPAGSFDLMVAYHVLEHLDRPSLFFEKSRELLKPGGHLFIELPVAPLAEMPLSKKRDPSIGYANLYHMHFFRPETLQPYFDRFGYTLLGTYTLYAETHPTGGFLLKKGS
jgi:SAM-dependent methyltransferase